MIRKIRHVSSEAVSLLENAVDMPSSGSKYLTDRATNRHRPTTDGPKNNGL